MHWGGLNLVRQKIEEFLPEKLSGDGRCSCENEQISMCNLIYSGLVKWCHPRTGKMIIMFHFKTQNTSTRALYKRNTTKPYQQQVYTNHFRVKQKKPHRLSWNYTLYITFCGRISVQNHQPTFSLEGQRPHLQLRLLRYNTTSVQLPTLGAGQMPELPNPDPPFFGTCVNFSI